ncbi:MAG: hypothetical protein HY286_17000 [Planctomycetes bacterium]|nr:hypothetical protein [Planctomycetota bacterium]
MNAELYHSLLRALLADDPIAALRVERELLQNDDRAAVERILNNDRERDGFILSSLLVKKLRFERVYRADDRLAAWFDRDPAAFAAAFREYHQSTPPVEYFGRPEARGFIQFLSSRGLDAAVAELARGG